VTHRIRHVEWRARVASPADAFALRTRLRQFVDTDLLPTLERAFDAAAGQETIHVPRIEMSLRVAGVDAIAVAIEASIREQAKEWPRPPATGMHDVAHDRVERPSSSASMGVDGVIRYLETGVLPWPLANLGREPTLALLETIARESADILLSAVPLSFEHATAFLFRWLQLVRQTDWIAIALSAERLSSSAQGIHDVVAALVRDRTVPISASPLVVARLLAAASIQAKRHIVRREDVVAALTSIARQIAGVNAADHRSPAASDCSAGPLGLAVQWIERAIAGGTFVASPPALAAAVGSAGPKGPPRESRDTGSTGGVIRLDEVAVDHAGLVLIHPFLPRLFERAGIAQTAPRSIAPEALPRAAALLAYAARGDDDPREFELGLIKVLLGLRPDTTLLVPAGLVSDADRIEIDDLLHSVVEHWQVLKHTSIGGLRTSFLQRQGLLADIDAAWRLRVEPHGFDVLLHHLPWALSTTTLPWMTKPIVTEWPTP
jgi:contractile injection system tape measure protein